MQRTGASGRRRGSWRLSSISSERKPRQLPSPATPSLGHWRKSPRKGREGEGGERGGGGVKTLLLLWETSSPSPAGGNICRARPRLPPTSPLWVFLSSLPSLSPTLLASPSQPRASSPPPRLPPSLTAAVAVAASTEPEMGRERARRSSFRSTALRVRSFLRPRRRCRRLGVPLLQSRS